jgi:tetratricopeptide (TPR) repeat protein
MQGDLVGQLDLSRQTLLIVREAGDRVSEAISLMNLGTGWLNLGDLSQARRELDAALQLLRTNGDRVMEATALVTLSQLALWQGDETRALALARQALDIAVATQAQHQEVAAGLWLGDAELALGRSAAARLAYAQARELALEIDSLKQHDASAGLARVALAECGAARGSTAAPAAPATEAAQAALQALQPLLDHLAAGGTLDGTGNPRLIELTVHQALALAGDPYAAEWLARAHTALMAQADAISQHSTDPALRHGFLNHIPHHRAIVAAWAGRISAG